jgi:hypothetical protein
MDTLIIKLSWDDLKKFQVTGASLRRASVGETGGGEFTGYFERWRNEGSENGASKPMGALLGEHGKGNFTGNLEGYIRNALETGVSLKWGFLCEAWKGVHLPGTYE